AGDQRANWCDGRRPDTARSDVPTWGRNHILYRHGLAGRRVRNLVLRVEHFTGRRHSLDRLLGRDVRLYDRDEPDVYDRVENQRGRIYVLDRDGGVRRGYQ